MFLVQQLQNALRTQLSASFAAHVPALSIAASRVKRFFSTETERPGVLSSVEGKKFLVLGAGGLVGRAVCFDLMEKNPRTIYAHSLNEHEAASVVEEFHKEKKGSNVELVPCFGDIFALTKGNESLRDTLHAYVDKMSPRMLESFNLYHLIKDTKPDVVIDCINTATGIAYMDIFKISDKVLKQLDTKEAADGELVEKLLESLYIPRMIRHIQVLYQTMTDFNVGMYLKVGTTGTGGMGMNIPYTHSEEKPSRVLLSKTAMAGAHSLLLFLMSRTPGAPITKEIKPAAAIGWKKITHGPIKKKGQYIPRMRSHPVPLGKTFSSYDERAAEEAGPMMENVFIDTGENGLFSAEEFSALTSMEQMEYVTPEDISKNVVKEIEGGNTGKDVLASLDDAVMSPSYRAGVMRHWALEKLNALQEKTGAKSIGFGALGPPRLTKLLFESQILRDLYGSITTARTKTADQIMKDTNKYISDNPEFANEVVSYGIPILLGDGQIIRGRQVTLPNDLVDEEATPAKVDTWAYEGWVDLRLKNCEEWVNRFERIHQEVEKIPSDDTSSRFNHNARFWHEEKEILPGKLVGWIMIEEHQGRRVM